jgi:hypothetical protein
LVGKTSTLDIGTEISKITIGRESVTSGESTNFGTTTIIKGSLINLIGPTTVTNTLTVSSGGARINGNTQVDYLGVGVGADTNYRIKVNGNISASIGYMTLGSSAVRNPAHISNLQVYGSVTFDPTKT